MEPSRHLLVVAVSMLFGSSKETRTPMNAIPIRVMYTMFPPASFHCNDIENNEEAMTGAMDLINDAVA